MFKKGFGFRAQDSQDAVEPIGARNPNLKPYGLSRPEASRRAKDPLILLVIRQD